MEVRFLSANKFKIVEATQILALENINVKPINLKINEIQTDNTELLIKDKIIKAFKEIGRPLFVEHTGLYIDYIYGFPGGLTQVLWDTLQADKFSELFGRTSNTTAYAKTVIGFCDSEKLYLFYGEIKGNISEKPRGNRDFQWDCVFIPEGYRETFSELGQKKNDISMRKIALDKFAKFLSGRRIS